MRSRLALAIFLSLVTLVFCHAFTAGSVNWDDPILVFGNPSLKMDFFSALYFNFTNYFHGDYLPVSQMSHWIDQNFLQLTAAGAHIENLILHLACVALVFLILGELGFSFFVQWGASLVFAVHPLQVETVMWISERKGLLSALFILGSLKFLISGSATKSALGYFLSVGSKMNAVLFPVLFWNQRKHLLGLCGAMVVLILVRLMAFSEEKQDLFESILGWDHWINAGQLFCATLGHYFSQFFMPKNLSIIYPNSQEPGLQILIGLLMFVGSLELVRRKRFDGLKFWIPFFLFWGLLLPVLNLVPRNSWANDRHMYLPLVGLAVFFLSALEKKLPNNAKFLVLGLLFLSLGLGSFNRSRIWVDSYSLWGQTTQDCPTCYLAWNNLALEKQQRGDFDGAMGDFEKVIQSQAESSIKVLAYNNLAVLFGDPLWPGRDLQKAVQVLGEGLRLAVPILDTIELRLNLAFFMSELGQKKQALDQISSVLTDLDRGRGSRLSNLREAARSLQSRLQAVQ